MKIIENYCNQPRPYADSVGYLKIELEEGDDREQIIKDYTKTPEHWYQETCKFQPTLSNEKLLVFYRKQPFLD